MKRRINTLRNRRKYTEEEIKSGILRCDTAIIEFFYNESYRVIRQMIMTNSGNVQDAEDIFQESIIVLFRKLKEPQFELKSSLTTFLYSIARLMWLKELHNRSVKRVDMKDTLDEMFDQDDKIIETIELNEKRLLYWRKFQELSSDCQRVLRMFLNSIPIKDITQSMGYSSDQHTKNRRFRCKKSLIEKIRSSEKFKELGNETNSEDRELPRW